GPAHRARAARRCAAGATPDAGRTARDRRADPMNAPALAEGADRAAVMIMLLGEEEAARLLSALSPEELQALGSRMCAMGDIGPGAIAESIANFAECAEEAGIPAHDRMESVRRIMTGALGDLKAENLMRRVAPAREPPRSPAL